MLLQSPAKACGPVYPPASLTSLLSALFQNGNAQREGLGLRSLSTWKLHYIVANGDPSEFMHTEVSRESPPALLLHVWFSASPLMGRLLLLHAAISYQASVKGQ